ncbi:uncharacterized protein METZ01_LOCUS271110 [marine metagenome]|uniref:Uncharacterized protein n=1 Tax=marine metagenome TaxID=408172 RepID=A0A382K2M5_9ZZZZ
MAHATRKRMLANKCDGGQRLIVSVNEFYPQYIEMWMPNWLNAAGPTAFVMRYSLPSIG